MPYHGIDWDGPHPATEDVEVPAIPQPLEEDNMEELLHTVCPTEPSNDYGIDVYSRTFNCIHTNNIYFYAC